MTKKILIADDSQTIQKVIRITLGDQDWDLLVANNESELLEHCNKTKFDLVLLDFGLAEEKSGYDLCREIRGIVPGLPVVILFGTFDSIDERALKNSGAVDKIVKPFDSQKFSQMCENILSTVDEETEVAHFVGEREKTGEIELAKFDLKKVDDQTDLDQEWVIEGGEGPEVTALSIEDLDDLEEESNLENQTKVNFTKDALSDEMSEWGLEVPGVIGHEDDEYLEKQELPPVIPQEKDEENQSDPNSIIYQGKGKKVEPPDHFPSNEDLEYPDIGVVNELSLEGQEEEESSADLAHIKLDPEFVALPEEIREENLKDLQDEPTNPNISVELQPKESDLKIQLEDESSDDFWSVDEIPNEGFQDKKELEKGNNQDVTPKSTLSHRKELFDNSSREEIKNQIRNIVEEIVRDEIKKHIEKIAWDLIPDLAERMIQKELKDITKQVMDQSE